MTTRSRAEALLLALVVLALGAGPAHGQTKTGTTLGDFVLIEPGARTAGMGNAGVGFGEGLQTVYFNPAGAALGQGRELLVSHLEWYADIRFDYVAAGLPLGRFGNAYAAVTSLRSGDIDVRTVEQPDGTGERYSAGDLALSLGYARQISDRFSGGIQVNYLQESIWHSSADAFTLSLGTLYRVAPNGLHIGASLTNFGTSAHFTGRDLRITYDEDPTRYGDNGALPGERYTESYPLPVLFRVGLLLPVQLSPGSQLVLAADAQHPSSNTESVCGGAELRFRNGFALRAGYQDLFQQDSELGLTLGAGLGGKVSEWGYRLDYAWADHQRLGATHRFSLGLVIP